MTCESWSEMLPFILNGSTSEEIRQNFRAHLPSCEVCRAELQECQWAWRVFQDHPPIEIITAKAFADALPQEVDLWLQNHVATCPACQTELKTAQKNAGLVDKKPFNWRGFAALAASLLLGFAVGYWAKAPQTVSAIQAVDLMPDTLRGANEIIDLDPNADHLLLILYPKNRPSSWEVEIFAADQRLHKLKGITPMADGSVSVLLKTGQIRSEGWRIVLSAEGIKEAFDCNWRRPLP